MSVKVAVRVRPFNSREKELKSTLCVDMKDNTTIIEQGGKTRPFTFDYSFWSHDEFKEDEEGYLIPTGEKYADQQLVYEAVGKEVLDNAWGGYHCCLFAYGQTGAGKSYSMIGYGPNKGIVPIAFNEIFERIKANKNDKLDFEVSFSMIEIYNEKIQDLLGRVQDRPKGGLKVRESKKYGVFVDGLSKWPVDNYSAIEEKMAIGNRNRTIGATDMNATSSRAHTIITINFKQIEFMNKKKVEKLSVINLVDLAGSEKVSKTNAVGDRLKEGCAINKSLTTLGLVISTLADKAMGKGKKKVVPYRNSALTRILQNALGGNSKTLMICAISPANNNYEETLSTLRYADQAKKIKCKAVVNESETDKMIRELKEENEKLKHLFTKLQSGEMPEEIGNLLSNMDFAGQKTDTGPQVDVGGSSGKKITKSKKGSSKTNPSTKATMGSSKNSAPIVEAQTEELKKKLKETEEMLAANAMMMEEYEKTFQQRLEESKKSPLNEHLDFDYDAPHISNVNEDPILTGKVLHNFKNKDTIRVGRKHGDPKPEIIISAIGISKNHAKFVRVGDAVFLEPESPDLAENIHLNGEEVEERSRLFHLDRIVFGTGTAFIFKDIKNAAFKRTMVEEKDIDLEYCQREITKLDQMDFIVKQVEEEATQKRLEEKEKALEDYKTKLEEAKIKMENTEMEQQRKEREKEYKEMEMQFEMQKMQRDFELEKHKQEILENEQKKLNKEKERKILEEKLAKFVPLITEVNLIARELKRDINLMPHLAYYFSENANDIAESDQLKRLRIKVKVENYEEGYSYIWDLDRFKNRYYMIKEELDTYFETNEIPNPDKEDDPFWDPPEPQLIGQGFLKLLSIAYLLDNPSQLVLVGDNGKTGILNVNLLPADDLGNPIDPDTLLDEEMIEDPRDMLDRRLDFVLQIKDGQLPEEFCANVFCKYAIQNGEKMDTFSTEILPDKHQFPNFNYQKHHTFETVTEKTLGYLLNANLCIKVYGNDDSCANLLDSAGEEEEYEEDEIEQQIQKRYEEKKLDRKMTVEESQRREEELRVRQQEEKLRKQQEEIRKKVGIVDTNRGSPSKKKGKKGKKKKRGKDDCNLI